MKIDFTLFEKADDGDTTHYGGSIEVKGQVIGASGNDRQFNNAHELNVIGILISEFDLTDSQAFNLYMGICCHEDGGVTEIERVSQTVFELSNEHNGTKLVDCSGSLDV